MCTLVVATRVWPRAPLVIAANRDEDLNRPAEPPQARSWHQPTLAPRDIQAGGTWIGLNASGVFVAITNRFGVPPDASKRSRGELVTRALRASCALEAADDIAGLPAGDYNPFHLVMADRVGAFLVWSDCETLHRLELPPGEVTVITERSFGATPSVREQHLAEEVPALAAGPLPSTERLVALMATHAEPGFDGVCVHWAAQTYGTRMTTVVRLGAAPDEVSYHYTDGPPCTAALVDLSVTAREMMVSSGDRVR